MYYELTDHFHVAATLARAWRFFGAAENLPLITPPWLKFRIAMATPAAIEQDDTIRWLGVPVRWRTKIIDWSPPRQFIDLQIKGPYTLWHHQHTFEATDGGVICRDRVMYKVPGGPAGWMANQLMVKRQLLQIFRFRRDVIGQRLGALKLLQDDVLIQR